MRWMRWVAAWVGAMAWMMMVWCGMSACRTSTAGSPEGSSFGPPRIQEEDLLGVLEINYSHALSDMIRESPFGVIGPLLEEKFPLRGKGAERVPFRIFRFVDGMSIEEMLDWVDVHGFQPAGIEHLLAIVAEYRDARLPVPIAGLGPQWSDPYDPRKELVYVPYVTGAPGTRRLSFLIAGRSDRLWAGWRFREEREPIRFLAVKRPTDVSVPEYSQMRKRP